MADAIRGTLAVAVRPSARASARTSASSLASTATPSRAPSRAGRCGASRAGGRRRRARSRRRARPCDRGTRRPPQSAPGSMAIRSWPTPGGAPSASKNELASKPKLAPVRATASTSTISASAAPLAPPIGSRVPLRAAAGSVVGLPSASTAQSGGIGSPFCTAVRILPRATWLSARSITIGGLPALRRGEADRIGAVDRAGCRPTARWRWACCRRPAPPGPPRPAARRGGRPRRSDASA